VIKLTLHLPAAMGEASYALGEIARLWPEARLKNVRDGWEIEIPHRSTQGAP
jgi:hypothetical protein